MVETELVLAADIGGSHITAALVNLTSKEIIASSLVRKHISASADAKEVLRVWASCIAEAMSNIPVAKICLAIPGPFDYEEGICLIKDQDKYPGLYGLNIKELLAAELSLHATDIYLNNDAGCFLQGEVFCGAVAGLQSVIGVTLGTGLGTAVCKQGKAGSADLWNLPFKETIAEDYISSRWFLQRYESLSGKKIQGVKELVQMADSNDYASIIFDEFGRNLGAFLIVFAKRENPEAVVIGGNIAQAFSLFGEVMMATLEQQFPNLRVTTSMHGEQAALLGAAGSWHMLANRQVVKA